MNIFFDGNENVIIFAEKNYVRDMDETAFLSSDGRYTIFEFNGTRLKFIAPYSLDRYCNVNTWDNGYIEVMTKYANNEELEEEYIDLIPVLESLYIDPAVYLKPIKKLEVRYV